MALIIDDLAIVAAEVAEVAVETTETATETASSGVEITAKSSANGSIDILETSGAKTLALECLPKPICRKITYL